MTGAARSPFPDYGHWKDAPRFESADEALEWLWSEFIEPYRSALEKFVWMKLRNGVSIDGEEVGRLMYVDQDDVDAVITEAVVRTQKRWADDPRYPPCRHPALFMRSISYAAKELLDASRRDALHQRDARADQMTLADAQRAGTPASERLEEDERVLAVARLRERVVAHICARCCPPRGSGLTEGRWKALCRVLTTPIRRGVVTQASVRQNAKRGRDAVWGVLVDVLGPMIRANGYGWPPDADAGRIDDTIRELGLHEVTWDQLRASCHTATASV